MKIILVLIILLATLMTNIVYADNFDEAERLIQSRVPCSSLNNDQLELMGDYYMEQMHPGSLHEIMDERMGGEGSESLRQVHINMARSFYCGQASAMPMGMMNTMMNRGGYNMYNMMGFNYGIGYSYGFFGWILMIAFWVAIIWLIVWVIQQIAKGKESSHDVLDKRLARGEISKKEYLELKKTLRR